MNKSIEQLAWEASQGNKESQREYAKHLAERGKKDWADFFNDKADGKNPHFSLECYVQSKTGASHA